MVDSNNHIVQVSPLVLDNSVLLCLTDTLTNHFLNQDQLLEAFLLVLVQPPPQVMNLS